MLKLLVLAVLSRRPRRSGRDVSSCSLASPSSHVPPCFATNVLTSLTGNFPNISRLMACVMKGLGEIRAVCILRCVPKPLRYTVSVRSARDLY